MIVDDALIMRKRIKGIAEEAGWEVFDEAEDGEQAVAQYQRNRPDLVTLDIVMPKLDGVSALREIMQHDSAARLWGAVREFGRRVAEHPACRKCYIYRGWSR